MSFAFVQSHRSEYRVQEMCRVLGVSPSGYYAWRSRPESARRREDRRLKVWIHSVHKEVEGAYGSPRIHRALRDQGVKCGRHRVARLMREDCLRARKRRRFRRTTLSDHNEAIAPNRLNQDFDVETPNRVWLADMTYISTRRGWLYLSAVMDLASRRIVGWSLEPSLGSHGPLAALNRALACRQPGGGLLHHSDRGVQYASEAYRTRLREVDAIQSMSRKGNYWDNSPMESFFASLKIERCSYVFEDRREARTVIANYIDGFYNSSRLHSSLDYQSPAQWELARATRFRGNLLAGDSPLMNSPLEH